MKHVINNTKNNMFKDEHLVWKIIALVFCIKRQCTKSNLVHISIYRHIYIYTNSYAYRCAHVCIYIIAYTYIPSVGIQCIILIMWDFSFLVLQNS